MAASYPFHRDAYKLDVKRVQRIVASLDLKIVSDPGGPAPGQGGRHGKRRKQLRKLRLGKAPARVTVILAPWELHSELNSLTDYFSEQCRVQCRFLGHPSPLEHWKRREEMKAARPTSKPPAAMSNDELREILYRTTRMCNNFRVTVAITVLRMFGARRWLDISAGWGDRLLSALLVDSVEFYCGVDPNPCLHPAYRDMIDAFVGARRRSRYVLIEGGFETAVLPAGRTYDLVFSSPPFFDRETYSDAPGDSMVAHPGGERRWFDGFLMPSLVKARAALEPGGHMVLYMAEARGTDYMGRMRAALSAMMHDCGSLYYKDHDTVREFLVWRK